MATVMSESVTSIGVVGPTQRPLESDTIEALSREAEQLKAKLDEERSKLADVDLAVAAERLEALPAFTMKPRRVLKGHQGKVCASGCFSTNVNIARELLYHFKENKLSPAPAANNESSEVFDIIKPGRRVKI